MAGNKEAFQKAMNQGHSAAWDQDWEKAADYYQAALGAFPENSQALSSLGLALFELQDYPAALQNYQKAARLSPEDPVPCEKIARIYERMGRLSDAINASLQAAEMHLKAHAAERAIDNWIRVLSLQPENVYVRTRLAAVYERMGRKEEAVAQYISAASLYQRSGDLTRAFKIAEYAHQLMPENQEIRMALSMLRSNRPLPRPSRPRGGTGPMHMAQVKDLEGRSEDPDSGLDPVGEARQKALVQLAALLFDQAEDNPGASASRGRGLSALTRGRTDSGGENGDQTRIILHLGQAIDSQTQNDHHQTIVELEYALNLGLRQPAAYFLLGMLLKDEDTDRALKHLQQSVKHPDYALASHLLVGQIYEQTEHWREAATSFIQALGMADVQVAPAELADRLMSQYDPLVDAQSSEDDSAVLAAVCKTVREQLLRPDWRPFLQKTRQNLPPQPAGSDPLPVAEMVLESRSSQVMEAMATVRQLASQGMVRSAHEEALYALQYAPVYLPLQVLIGDLLVQEQRYAEAVEKYMVVANLYTVRGEVTRAVRMLKRVCQLMPMNLNVRLRLIELLVAQENIEDALEEYVGLADQYYRLAELDKARQTYLDGLKIAQKARDSRTWGVNLMLKVADIDLQRLNLRQALRIYEQIRTIQPDLPEVRAQIVHLNFRLGMETAAIKDLDDTVTFLENHGRRQEAIEFIQELLVDHANQIDLRRRLADLYLRNNQIPEAVTVLDTVADTLVETGRHIEAVNMLETIISLRPPNIEDYKIALEALRREMLRR